MTSNEERFRDFYKQKLRQYVTEKPEEYTWPIEELDVVVDKMIDGMKRGSAHIGPAAKWAAKMCGVIPSVRGIKEFLNAD